MPRRQSLHSVSGQRPNPTLVEAGPWPLVLADPRRIGLLPLGLRVVRETGNLTRIQDRVKGSKAFLFQCFWTLRFCLQITRFPWVISLSKPRPASVGLLQRLAWFARVKKTEPRPKSWSRLVHPMSASRESDSSDPPLLRKCSRKGFFKTVDFSPVACRTADYACHARGCKLASSLPSIRSPPIKKHRALCTVPFVLTLIYRLTAGLGLSAILPAFAAENPTRQAPFAA
jgi:hypothetical protein